MKNARSVAISMLILCAMLAAAAAYMNYVGIQILEPNEEIAKIAYRTNLKMDLFLCCATLAIAALLQFSKSEKQN